MSGNDPDHPVADTTGRHFEDDPSAPGSSVREVLVGLGAAAGLLGVNFGLLAVGDGALFDVIGDMPDEGFIRLLPTLGFIALGVVELIGLYVLSSYPDGTLRKHRATTLALLFPLYWLWPMFLLVFLSLPIDAS